VGKEFFVESFETDFLVTVLVIVPKGKLEIFKNEYEVIVPNCVVPKSLRFLNRDDREGNTLHRIVCFSHSVDNMLSEGRKRGFVLKKFVYDEVKYREDQ
jgi:hypothetical protein